VTPQPLQQRNNLGLPGSTQNPSRSGTTGAIPLWDTHDLDGVVGFSLMEEAGFRGYFQVALEREVRDPLAVVISSIFKVRTPCSPWYTGWSWLPRNNSASLRASIRSLLLPSFKRAFFRGSQTTSRLTWGFRRSCNQAADVPSSKVSDRVPCNPRMNSTIVRPWSPASIP
jgi:hypothetical protein